MNILTITLGTNDTYTLNVTGNFVHQVGIRWWARGNRKTTTTATIQSNLVSEIQSSAYYPATLNDADNNVILQLRTGNYATSFTISGNVGAAGDVIIITEIYAQIVLRGNNPDSLGNFGYWEILIKEKGIMTVTSRHVTIDASSQSAGYYIITSNGWKQPYQSPSGTDIIVSDLIFSTNNAPEVIWHANFTEDTSAYNLFLYVNIIIIGV